jgi:hypothetical protein
MLKKFSDLALVMTNPTSQSHTNPRMIKRTHTPFDVGTVRFSFSLSAFWRRLCC